MARLDHRKSFQETAVEQVQADNLFQFLKSKTPAEVEQYFQNNLSALSGMAPATIENWIDANITNLAEAKDALKTLAKDSAFTSDVVRMLAKAITVLAKQVR